MMKNHFMSTIHYFLLIIISFCLTGSNTLPTLKDTFKDYFLIGGALNDDCVSGEDNKAADIAILHFNTITPENCMKWSLIHPKLNKYDFDASDRFVNFGLKHKMFMVGHTLIWHYQVPDWVFVDESNNKLTREALLERMKNHIFTVVGRYKGKINAWDVVNEAIDNDGSLIKSKWLEIIGEDYIAKAFQFAHEADPNAELYYNDYMIEKPARRDAVIKIVKKLQSEKIRIDGVGIQAHWSFDEPDKKEFDIFVKSISALGLKVMITELDVDILPNPMNRMGADVNFRAHYSDELNPYKKGLTPEMEKKLADRYAELFKMILSHKKNISRVTFWGVYDGTSWLNNWPIRGRTNYPLLFDRNYQPKQAYQAVINTVKSEK